MRWTIALPLLLLSAPAWSFQPGFYEGQATFLIGNRHCPTQGPSLKFEIGQDGKVTGGVRTLSKTATFATTVGADGKLAASYQTGADADKVMVEATVTDARLEGFTQSPSCKYKLSFERR